MKRGELEQQLARTNAWWKKSKRPWAADDPDLVEAAAAPFTYQPDPLEGIKPKGLYLLFGPRRVGKSVELKRTVERLLDTGVKPRQIIHAACDGWRDEDLQVFVDYLDSISPPADGYRYVLLDEVTGIRGDWIARLKWLRDNTDLKQDCVVLTGSSSAELAKARAEFGGRHGPVADWQRYLLQMSFRSFCWATGTELPEIPTIHPRDILGKEAGDAIQELRVYLDDLVPLWERYLDVGGFPRAVGDWVSDRQVSDAFLGDLWDVFHGDALESGLTPAESQALLGELSSRLANPFNVSNVAHQIGVSRDVLVPRLAKATQSFIVWPCSQNNGNDQAATKAWKKYYFLDPLYARLAAHRDTQARAPDYTELTEQQIGGALLRAHEADEPGKLADYGAVFYYVSPTRKEIDFTGAWLGGVPFEGKYTDAGDPWKQEAATAKSAYGKAVFATRTVVERDGDLLAVPAAILALLLDPTSPDAVPVRP